jgi:peptidoglycan/LPS O-acetylase OafA/YrhL
MKDVLAPRFATWLFERFLSPTDREAISGDLMEEYAFRYRASPRLVVPWYWGQVCRSIAPLLWIRLRREKWMSTLSVALVAFIVAGAIESAGIQALSSLLGSNATAPSVLTMVVGLATLMLSGYLAAWVRPFAANVLAVLEILAVVILMVTMPTSAPLWYGLAFLVFGPLAAFLGGTFHRPRAREQS